MAIRAWLIPILLALLLSCSPKPSLCWVCEREIHPEVRATLTLGDGRRVPACCPRCALHYKQESATAPRAITVTDHAGGGSLPFEKAFLVEGSDETPCIRHHPVLDERRTPMHVCYDRCMPSLIAFAAEGAARAFVREHGGTLHAPGSLTGLPVEGR